MDSNDDSSDYLSDEDESIFSVYTNYQRRK